MSLLGVLLENASQQELKWFHESHKVNESEHLKPVELKFFPKEDEVWDSTDHIEDEVASQVVDRDGVKLLEGSGPLDEVEHDLKEVDDINSSLNVLESLLSGGCGDILLLHFIPVLVDIMEHNDEWCHEHAVDSKDGDEEVPHLAEGPLRVDQVPLQLWLVLIDRAVLISILVDVVDHHFFEVRLSHLLETGLESELIVVTSSLLPQLLHSLVLLLLGHALPLSLRVRLAEIVLA